MRRTNKHAANVITFAALNGGINIALSGEQIAENEMQVCENFLYQRDSQKLVGRGGLSEPIFTFESDIKELFYDIDTNTSMAFLQDKKAYSLVGSKQPELTGRLTGSSIPVCAKFKEKLWIASGEKLQYYDFSGTNGLFTVMDSPLCDICFERFGRLLVAMTGSDRLTYSGTGDGSYWYEDTNDASSSNWIDIGPDDSGDILAVVPLATDMMVIKSNGKVYQFSGDSSTNTWAVYNIANNTDPVGIGCAANIGSSVVFLSRRGLKSLNTTMDYGNIAPGDIGDKFNGLITKKLFEPRIFHLKRHRTLLIRPSSDWSYFICYNYGVGAATVLRFGLPITSVVERMEDVLVASGNSIYKWDEAYTLDSKLPITYRMKPKDILGANKLLVKSVDTKFTSDRAGIAKVKTGKLSLEMPTNTRRKVRCNHSTDCISLEVTSNSAFSLDHLALEVADL